MESPSFSTKEFCFLEAFQKSSESESFLRVRDMLTLLVKRPRSDRRGHLTAQVVTGQGVS